MNDTTTYGVSKWLRYKPLLWMFAIPFLNIFYQLLNEHEPGVRVLMTPFDAVIPFIPAFIIPYITWYPFIAVVLVLIFLKDVKTYLNTLFALCLGLIVCYVFYYYFQTTVPRPIVSTSGLLNKLVSIIYEHDLPYNCFPSIHVLTTYLVMKGATVLKNTTRIVVHIVGILIIASTVFVKQHVVADVAMAIIVAEFTFGVATICVPYLTKLKVRLESIS